MSSEKFDKKVKEAADHHHPVYDELAWTDMEKLLDKHLPVKDNRRRRFLFLIFFLLLLSGAGIYLIKRNNFIDNSDHKIISQTQEPNLNEVKSSRIQNSQSSVDRNAVPEKQMKINSGSRSIVLNDVTKKINILNINGGTSRGSSKFQKGKQEVESINHTKSISDNIKDPKNVIVDLDPAMILEKPGKTTEKKPVGFKSPVTPANVDDSTKLESSTEDPQVKKSILNNQEQVSSDIGKNYNDDKPAPANEGRRKKSSLFFTLSTGPDVSFAGGEKTGELKPVFGIGVGLTLKSRFSIKTGFFAGRKIYSAAPSAYNPPSSFYNYYPYLENVDADCKVFEIPLTLSYNFGENLKGHWFASIGLSSYLMKKETYHYTYKNSLTGPTLKKSWSIKNENNHLFSVLALSSGYHINLGKSTFILIEPNFKLPLSGVGYGKVKLNSAGILVSFGINPFGAKKK